MFAFLKGWKTVAFNALAAVLPILQLTELQAVMPDAWLPWYALGVALANLALRHVTTGTVGYRPDA